MPSHRPGRGTDPLIRLAILACLWIGTTALYVPVREHAFLDYDDRQYVHGNAHVTGGFTREGIAWAFTTDYAANWHPLTWMSHQLDVTLFGLDPSGHHQMSVGLHALNVLLLFVFLSRATGSIWRSAFVSAVFAVHPLQVDSVAWIAERKNLLCTTFGFAALLAYLGYCARPGAKRYALVALLFALGMMAKPMLVTLPLLLLLLDFWPLRRLADPAASGSAVDRSLCIRRGLEKLPLLAIAALGGALTVWAQRSGGAVEGLEPFPIGMRIANAVVGYATHLQKLLWPSPLSVLYPHPDASLAPSRVFACAVVLIALAAAVARAGRRRPFLWTGALWFAISLLPVIGLVQAGAQAVADRYAYLPMVGALVALTWLAASVLDRLPRALPALAACASIAALATVTRGYLPMWRNEIALFGHAVEVHEASGVETRHAMILYYQLGTALAAAGRHAEAIPRYERAVELNPDYARAHNNLGAAYAAVGRPEEAAGEYAKALEVFPRHDSALYNLGLHRLAVGDVEGARPLLARYLAQGSHGPAQREVIARSLLAAGAAAEALRVAELASEESRRDPNAHAIAAEAARRLGNDARAKAHLERALELVPHSRVLRSELADLLASSENDAIRDPERALELLDQLQAEGPLDAAEIDTLSTTRSARGSGPAPVRQPREQIPDGG